MKKALQATAAAVLGLCLTAVWSYGIAPRAGLSARSMNAGSGDTVPTHILGYDESCNCYRVFTGTQTGNGTFALVVSLDGAGVTITSSDASPVVVRHSGQVTGSVTIQSVAAGVGIRTEGQVSGSVTIQSVAAGVGIRTEGQISGSVTIQSVAAGVGMRTEGQVSGSVTIQSVAAGVTFSTTNTALTKTVSATPYLVTLGIAGGAGATVPISSGSRLLRITPLRSVASATVWGVVHSTLAQALANTGVWFDTTRDFEIPVAPSAWGTNLFVGVGGGGGSFTIMVEEEILP